MKDGAIAEIGTHDELMELNGLYKELVEAQMFEYETKRAAEREGNQLNWCGIFNFASQMHEFQQDGHVENILDDFTCETSVQKHCLATHTREAVGKDVVKTLNEG